MTDYEYLVLGSLYTDNSSKMLLLDNFSIMIESEEHLPTVEENEPIVRQYNTLLKNAQKFDNLKSYDHHHLYHFSNYESMIFMLAYHKKLFSDLQMNNQIIKRIFKLIEEREFDNTDFSLTSYGDRDYLMINSNRLPLILIQIESI